MFKFSTKQKLAIKSWFHAAIVAEVFAFTYFANTFNGSLTLGTGLRAAAVALLAPITRYGANLYSKLAILYPWLKPIAAYIAKRAAKKVATPTK